MKSVQQLLKTAALIAILVFGFGETIAALDLWKHNDLTKATGAPGCWNSSAPAGYTWDVDKTQHVVYRGVDDHIYELWFSSNSWTWSHNDLTNATGAPRVASGTPGHPALRNAPAGYTWDVDKTQHVVYRGVDEHIHELWFSSSSWTWNHNDLTKATGAPPPRAPRAVPPATPGTWTRPSTSSTAGSTTTSTNCGSVAIPGPGATTISRMRPAPPSPRAIQPATPGTWTRPSTSSTAGPATSTNCGSLSSISQVRFSRPPPLFRTASHCGSSFCPRASSFMLSQRARVGFAK